jgi:hypothetical protein
MRALTIALCLLATPALADVAGVASVIDGDTIELGFRDVSPPGEKPVIKEFGLVR